MQPMELSPEKEMYIEETGLIFELMGATRMAGRILGYMMVCEKTFVSFGELTDVIHASKSSISTNVKALINIGYIKLVTFPADRKTYYALDNSANHQSMMENKMVYMEKLADHAKRGLGLRDNLSDSTSEWIKEMTDFYDWLLANIPAFLKQYQERNS